MHLPTFSQEVKAKWFVKKDESGDEFIRLNGRKALLNDGLDHIFQISSDRVGAWLTRRNTKQILAKVPGSKIEQAGSEETIISCGIEHLELLCDAVGAKRRPVYTAEQREIMADRKYGTTGP
ncbi:MAG: hypothetical protein DRP56_09140 [Planctomycetota bacterium]|nr:MAG: hypothetical protein DRP56_09140 [Planctomycetota bacterium]